MTRDEIYDHLAKVYLDKRESVADVKPVPKKSRVGLVINIVITAFVLVSVVYGLTAFLTQRNDVIQSRVIYSLNNSPIRLNFTLGGNLPQVKGLTLAMPEMDVAKFRRVNVSLKAVEGGNPGTIKLVLANRKEEKASYYLQGIRPRWQDYSVSFEDLNLTDWKTLKDISFVVEAWNAERPAGAVLIDNITFSN